MKLLKTKIKPLLIAAVLILVGFGIGMCISSLRQDNQSNTQDTNTISQPEASQGSVAEESAIYYWVPDGEVYHLSKSCPTLNRSTDIREGTIPPADRRACKVCS